MFCDFETKGTIADRDPRTRSQYLLLSIWIVRFSMERFKDLQVFHNALLRMVRGTKGQDEALTTNIWHHHHHMEHPRCLLASVVVVAVHCIVVKLCSHGYFHFVFFKFLHIKTHACTTPGCT